MSPAPPITVHVVEDTHTFEGDNDETISCGGYRLDAENGMYRAERRTRPSARAA